MLRNKSVIDRNIIASQHDNTHPTYSLGNGSRQGSFEWSISVGGLVRWRP
jgi:hypothetical protein